MKYFYLILVFILFIPFNLKSQFQVKELNDSILKPKIIDFSKCSCVDSTSRLDYCIEISDLNSSDDVYSLCELLIKSLISFDKVDTLDSTLAIFHHVLDEGVMGATGSGYGYIYHKTVVFHSKDKYYLWDLPLESYNRGSNQNKGELFETSEESETRTIKLSNDTLYISKWYVHYKREGIVNDAWISEKDSAFNRLKAKEYSESKNDTIGGDLIYKFEFPNFVRVNH